MQEAIYDDFRDLEVWQRCRNIRKEIWALCKQFPEGEKFRLCDQMIRSSRSSTACIAEGYGRYHFQENIQFSRQSRGSLYELIDHLNLARECRYLRENTADELIAQVKTTIRVLNGYIRYLRRRKECHQSSRS